MSLPEYPTQRVSGVSNLGLLPAHWRITRLGYESWVRARLGWKGLKAEEYVEDGFALLSTPNIKGREIDFINVNFISQYRFDESPEIKLKEGDVLLAKDGSTLGTANIVRHLPRPATVNSSIAVITPSSKLDGNFLYYFLLSAHAVDLIAQAKGGMGVPHLFQEDLNRFELPLPPLDEQVCIAAFLDHETAKIDALIAEQEQLIGLLQEKRQVVISCAVTKGLNPDVPMKPSGVEWLGDVPAHWSVNRVKNLCVTISKGTTPTTVGADFTTEGVRFLKAENITDIGVADQPSFYISQETHAVLSRSNLQDQDVLVVIAGATTGKSAVLQRELLPANTNQAVAFVRLMEPRLAPFLCMYLTTGPVRSLVSMNSVQSAQPNLSMEDLGNIPIPLPPPSELKHLMNALLVNATELQSLIVEAERAVNLLQERRSALISAAVTGQIDVRGLVEQAVA